MMFYALASFSYVIDNFYEVIFCLLILVKRYFTGTGVIRIWINPGEYDKNRSLPQYNITQ